MKHQKSFACMSVDEILAEAVTREEAMKKFYAGAVCVVGPDACTLVSRFVIQSDERIRDLENLRIELRELQDLTASIAD